MTDIQYNTALTKLHDDMRAAHCGFVDGKYITPPPHLRKQEKILTCVSMLNSILAYRYFGSTPADAENILQNELNTRPQYLTEYTRALGKKTVLQLLREQLDDIDRIEIGTHTDSEGCSYNSIVWKIKE